MPSKQQQDADAEIIGETVIIDLDTVKPNTWNPNKMDTHTFEGVKAGLRDVGWVKSAAMLVWGSDEHGTTKNIIINGEHRWRAARDLGRTKGPAMFMCNLPEREAKALTVRLDNAHGDPDREKIAALLRSMRGAYTDAELAQQCGVDPKMLSLILESSTMGEAGEYPQGAGVRVVMLPVPTDEHAEFMLRLKRIGARLELETVTETVLTILEEECRSQ